MFFFVFVFVFVFESRVELEGVSHGAIIFVLCFFVCLYLSAEWSWRE